MRDHKERLKLAREALEGLSVGDAVGEALSYRYSEVRESCDFSVFRDGSLRYTDDTEMAMAVFGTLRVTRAVSEDALAWAYSSRFRRDPDRGYGRMARRILDEIAAGVPWQEVSAKAFGGGSFGNGAAMRVAPLGAYYADEYEIVPEMAARSARVTHFHPEGIAGAVAVAAGAAAAAAARLESFDSAVDAVWSAVIALTPESAVRDKLVDARSMTTSTHEEASHELGNGSDISSQDTVPFCLWNACRCLDDYEEAILSTIEVGGDCDTNSAIVGGIVSSYTGISEIPSEWLRVRERLDVKD